MGRMVAQACPGCAGKAEECVWTILWRQQIVVDGVVLFVGIEDESVALSGQLRREGADCRCLHQLLQLCPGNRDEVIRRSPFAGALGRGFGHGQDP